MGGRNWEMVAILQEIGQDMFSKTFLQTIVVECDQVTHRVGNAAWSARTLFTIPKISNILKLVRKIAKNSVAKCCKIRKI